MLQPIVVEQIKRLISDLVRGDISALVTDCRVGRLTESEICEAIERYPGTLSMPPDHVFDHIQAIPVRNSNPPELYVDFDLWCDGELSDLTVSFSVILHPFGSVQICLEDIHVM